MAVSFKLSVLRWRRVFLILGALFALLPQCVLAEPVQYCQFGDPAKPNQDIDFCLGVSTRRNETTGAHNVYLTLTHTRRHLWNKGWTAVGIGEDMTGSLMFILYGDPASEEKPIVSIRSSTGHHQPQLLTRAAQMGGGDLRVLRSDWISGDYHRKDSTTTGTVTAMVSIVCYSCTLWRGGAKLSATATSQPWIWAWNKAQEFDVYDYDTHLLMHAHHAGNGGWGRFYVDMARAESTGSSFLPSVPVIRPGIAALGTSDEGSLNIDFAGWMTNNPVLRVHGILMSLAFLLLFPWGVIAMRSGSPRSFKYHWIIQAVASAATIGGLVAGLMLQRKINMAHQIVGLSIASALGLQALLGWKHHADFVRIWRRTYFSYAHLWLGRALMIGGSVNLILGLLLRGYSRTIIAMAAAFVILQSISLIFWVWRHARRAAVATRAAKYQAVEEEGDDPQACFVIDSSEETDDEGVAGDEKDPGITDTVKAEADGEGAKSLV